MSIGRIVRQRVRISGERLSHLAPCHAEPASCKIGEFVEPLRAEDSAALEPLLRPRRARIDGETVDEGIVVEEFARTLPGVGLLAIKLPLRREFLAKRRIRTSACSRLLSRAMPN